MRQPNITKDASNPLLIPLGSPVSIDNKSIHSKGLYKLIKKKKRKKTAYYGYLGFIYHERHQQVNNHQLPKKHVPKEYV